MNDSTLSVAVVIPTHNRDRELERALASVLAQTHRPASILVVDDAGSADTRAVVEGTELRVSYVNGSDLPVRGAGASRNLGARLAEPSDFLAFLDDDDYWSPVFLAKTLRRLVEGDLDLVVSWAAMSDGTSTLPHAWHAVEGLGASEVAAENPGVTGSNFVVRRSAFDAIGGFDAAQWVFNDLDFFFRLLQSGASYGVVAEDLETQTVSPGSHLSSRSDRRAAGIERYIEKHSAVLDPRQLRILQRQANLARLHRRQDPRVFTRAFVDVVRQSTLGDWRKAVKVRLGGALGYN